MLKCLKWQTLSSGWYVNPTHCWHFNRNQNTNTKIIYILGLSLFLVWPYCVCSLKLPYIPMESSVSALIFIISVSQVEKMSWAYERESCNGLTVSRISAVFQIGFWKGTHSALFMAHRRRDPIGPAHWPCTTPLSVWTMTAHLLPSAWRAVTQWAHTVSAEWVLMRLHSLSLFLPPSFSIDLYRSARDIATTDFVYYFSFFPNCDFSLCWKCLYSITFQTFTFIFTY